MGYTENIRWQYKAIESYKEVDNPNDWMNCPKCGLKPMAWEFDNGRCTACGCGESNYDHHSIHAESVMSVILNSDTKKSAEFYNVNELRDNWNHWVNTGEVIFNSSRRSDGRW